MKQLFFLLTVLATLSASAQTDPAHPNILLILADDLGVDAVNGYQQNPLMPVTPTLDSLQANGLTFKNAWATPKCTPSRAAIMSGKYGVKTGVTGTPGHLDTLHQSIFRELEARTDGAYADALIGKWHLAHPVDMAHPSHHGVDHFEGIFTAGVEDYYHWTYFRDSQESVNITYATRALTDAATDWINQQDRPWLLWLSHVTPHSPFQVPPEGTYRLNGTESRQRKFIAMLENLDYELGRLLSQMPMAVRNNTIIIFMGDNGTTATVVQQFPSDRAKPTLYQGGIHVPLIVSGAGVARKNEEEQAMVHVVDLYATMLELAGVDLPGGIYNSLSFAPLLQGESDPTRSYNYSELSDDQTGGWTIRNERYKLIHFTSGDPVFYDLIDDPLETRNLIDSLTPEQLAVKTDLEEEAAAIRNNWSCRDNIRNGTETEIDQCQIMVCNNDNDTSKVNIGCCATPEVASLYTEQLDGDVRHIATNNFPNHDYCFNSNLVPTPRYYNFRLDATPARAASPTSILTNTGRPDYYFGVSLNGVLLAPAPAQPFIFENPETGEYNWDWVLEPTNNQGDRPGLVKLDCASAHTGPQGYHYHGNMFEYVESLRPGISTANTPPPEPFQIGWAADGFPILYRFGPDEQGQIKELQPGYRLKAGLRPGDGITAPCDEYNGKYTNDYEHVAELGDLDQCNGVERAIILTTPNGTETFDYFYMITTAFPQIPRCITGTPDQSFNNSNTGSPTGTRELAADALQLRLHPNPAGAWLEITYTPTATGTWVIELLDLTGQVLRTDPQNVTQALIPQYHRLRMNELRAGVHLVRLSHSGTTVSRKFIKL